MNTLAKRIEAILFVHGEPMTLEGLAKLLDSTKTNVREELVKLDEHLTESALRLVYQGDSVQLVTREQLAKDLEALVNEEVSRDLSRASAETLAAIVYKGPISKRDLDYIRGVNSSYILRNLLIRGLIERAHLKDGRTYVYQPSIELLKFLGIGRLEELPEYEAFRERLRDFIYSQPQEE